MRFKLLFFTNFLFLVFLLNGCSDSANTTNSVNTANKPANISATNAEDPLITTKKTETATTNNAPTFAPVVEAYYAALLKKDEAGAKKVLSQSAIKYWEKELNEDLPTLLAVLEDNEAPVEVKREVRNEKITGDKGVAEVRGGSLGVWTPIAFVKENNEWKFASPKESLDLQETGK